MLKNSGEITVYRLYAKCVKNSLSRRVCQDEYVKKETSSNGTVLLRNVYLLTHKMECWSLKLSGMH